MAKPRFAPTKVPMPEQRPEVRRQNFNEVPLGYTEALAIEEAKRCIQCKNSPCIAGCPVAIDIPAFIRFIAAGDFKAAIQKMKEKNLLPAVCGRVCPQEDQCEKVCTLAAKFEPVAIGRLERFIADWERQSGDFNLPEIAPATGKKVAIIGAGPAGLTAAGDLCRFGHEVTLFEALHKPGGVLVYGIPEFRLPKSILDYEVDLLSKMGVKIVSSFVVGMSETLDDLLQKFDAIFIGTGAGLPYFMNIPGESLNGVYSANEYLTRSNLMKAYLFPDWDTPIVRSRTVAVIGGGNVAMDSARTAVRLGAEKVYIIYRRSRQEMPARIEEIHHAEEEGVILNLLQNPIKIIGDEKGWVREIICIRMELGEPDASGRRRPVPVKGSEFSIPVDTIIMAIGQGPNPLIPQTTPALKVGKWGNIVADPETGATSMPGVFAGGDIVTGGATVILAMGAARKSAKALDNFLKNSGSIAFLP
ncbi:NADPH-dependent glutamate synthase [candidate division KSB1 bacterium]|nr:NADPH-dependent glutamate synthase [candidate division KSB1 bacterium]